MKLSVKLAMAAAILTLLFLPAIAQDSGTSTGLKPDLPLEKPVPESPDTDDDNDTDEPPPPPEDVPPPGEDTPPPETPVEEEPPANPPPEFFEEPIETGEVIFVIDRTGSMGWPSKMSVTDENGNPVNNCAKIDVARIELIKTLKDLAENMKFAIVGYSAPATLNPATQLDPNWGVKYDPVTGGLSGAIRWDAWPPARGEPAPGGFHATAINRLPVWPASKTLVPATVDNKTAALGWAGANLTISVIGGNTSIYNGMSVALKMVSPPEGGGAEDKSPTAIYLLTDGAPNVIDTTVYGSVGYSGWGSDETWGLLCMSMTKTKILSENIHNATIYTLGIGMNMACPNANVWNPGTNAFDLYPTEYNDHCRKFLTELAEATGGHYREVSQ